MKGILEQVEFNFKNNDNLSLAIESISNDKLLVTALVTYFLAHNEKTITNE